MYQMNSTDNIYPWRPTEKNREKRAKGIVEKAV